MQSEVITHANTSNGIKIPFFLKKSWGMMLHLSSAPLRICFLLTQTKANSKNVYLILLRVAFIFKTGQQAEGF